MELNFKWGREIFFPGLVMRTLSRQGGFELNLEGLENFVNTEIAMKPSPAKVVHIYIFTSLTV